MITTTETMREVIRKFKPHKPTQGLSTMQRLMLRDPGFRTQVQEMENFWLSEANDILKDIMDKVKEKIQDPDITLDGLIKALDVISTKYNLHLGKPTAIDFGVKVSHSLSDDDLNHRILELQSQFLSPPSLEPPLEENLIGEVSLTDEQDNEELG